MSQTASFSQKPNPKPQEEGRSSLSLHLMAAAMAPALSIFSSPFFASRPQAFPPTTVFCSYSVNFSPTSFHSLQRFNTPQRTRKNFVPKADDGDGDVDVSDYYEMVDEEIEEVDNKRDYDVEYEPLSAVGGAHGEGEIAMVDSKTFVSTQGWESETIVDYRIDEDEFHKISLLDCDFFIRKPPDPDNDVYDFREMYVTPPDTDVYAIPKVLAPMPQKYIRCAQSDYGCYNVTEPPIDAPRDPLYKSEREILKVFLFKHYKNRRLDDPEFVLDFEEIYVIDSKTKSITRAKVLVTVPGGKNRDRKRDLLKVRDGGTLFKIIDQSEREDPATVIEKEEWAKTRLEMERHLSKLRDFDKSNWF